MLMRRKGSLGIRDTVLTSCLLIGYRKVNISGQVWMQGEPLGVWSRTFKPIQIANIPRHIGEKHIITNHLHRSTTTNPQTLKPSNLHIWHIYIYKTTLPAHYLRTFARTRSVHPNLSSCLYLSIPQYSISNSQQPTANETTTTKHDCAKIPQLILSPK